MTNSFRARNAVSKRANLPTFQALHFSLTWKPNGSSPRFVLCHSSETDYCKAIVKVLPKDFAFHTLNVPAPGFQKGFSKYPFVYFFSPYFCVALSRGLVDCSKSSRGKCTKVAPCRPSARRTKKTANKIGLDQSRIQFLFFFF